MSILCPVSNANLESCQMSILCLVDLAYSRVYFRARHPREQGAPGVRWRVEVCTVDPRQAEAHRAQDGNADEGARADARGEGRHRPKGREDSRNYQRILSGLGIFQNLS